MEVDRGKEGGSEGRRGKGGEGREGEGRVGGRDRGGQGGRGEGQRWLGWWGEGWADLFLLGYCTTTSWSSSMPLTTPTVLMTW